MADVLQQCFERILRAYLGAREEGTIEPQHPVSADFEELRQLLTQHIHLAAHDDIQSRWSVGRGNWARIPWIGFFDERETTSAQYGVYIAYLFREDMSGVYACLVHGVQKIWDEHGVKGVKKVIKKKVTPLRNQVSWLKNSGFELLQPIDLRSSGRLAKAYEYGVFAHKLYALDALPDDAEIMRDLDDLTDAYDAHVSDTPGRPSQYWMLSPDSNGVTQRAQLRAKDTTPQVGDAVYLWRDDALTQGALVGQSRVVSINADVDTNRGIELELKPLEFWDEPVDVHALEDVTIKAAYLPTERHRLKPMIFDVEQAITGVLGERAAHFDLAEDVGHLIGHIQQQGWCYEPWQIAAYVTALRTKPFVILAGISGTGKSRLPGLVASLTGGRVQHVPVRPGWTDSAEVLGYRDLTGAWRPGTVLMLAHDAMVERQRYSVCVLDEMNLAHVEHYLAEVLSVMEDRREDPHGGWCSQRVLSHGDAIDEQGREWSSVYLPANFGIVGTVNMDESTHGFSRKVLDRAFTLELSDVNLSSWRASASTPTRTKTWSMDAWTPRATRLAELTELSEEDIALIDRCVEVLTQLNAPLSRLQLHVGYRTRDEVALFVLHAQDVLPSFRSSAGLPIDPLDIAVAMKVLPRLVGGSVLVREVLSCLLCWAFTGEATTPTAERLERWLNTWASVGSANHVPGSAYPFCAAKLCVMWQRLRQEGYTSYWS